VSEDKKEVMDAAKSMGLRAARDRDGTVTLQIPATQLPAKLREFVEQIAVPAVEADMAATMLARVLLWARRNGYSTDQVLMEAALERIADQTTLAAITVAIDRDAGLVGTYQAPCPRTPHNFADFVRRLSIAIDRALDEHGETPRLRHLRSMIGAIREDGIEQYECDDPARAARLLALGPEILASLDN
jgi:acetolactate synthase regulatory subunit